MGWKTENWYPFTLHIFVFPYRFKFFFLCGVETIQLCRFFPFQALQFDIIKPFLILFLPLPQVLFPFRNSSQ